MTLPLVEHYLIQGSDGNIVSVGKLQATWLHEGGFIERDPDRPGVWLAQHDLSMRDINRLVISNPDLRSCDFCETVPAGWRINCNEFTLQGNHSLNGASMGGDERPVFACDVCVPYVRENRKMDLLERMLEVHIQRARDMGGTLRTIVDSNSPTVIRRALLPLTREIVNGVFANRRGFPVEDR